MKKSILKSVVSVFAAATMAITSANIVLAENDYLSYTNDFSSASGVTVSDNLNYTTANRDDIVMVVTDGVLKTTRKMYDYQESEYRSNSAKASIALGKSFSEGKIQAKFDFTFDEDSERSFGFVFDGYHTARADAGVVISKSHARLLRTNGASTWLPFNEDTSEWIQGGVTYTATISLDIATAKYTISIVNKNNPSDAKSKSAVFDWGGTEAGPITGVSFYSSRTEDKGLGVIVFDNLSVDAYTETNYVINSIYRDSNGFETNKQMDGYTFKGYTLSKLTNIPAPANASFITASYDGYERMIGASVKPVAELDGTPVNADVTGDTVKSFVLDMSNADPLVPVYQYADPATTMRKLDFEFDGNYKVGDPYQRGVTADFVADIDTYGISYNNTWAGVGYEKVLDGENNVLRVERSVFKSGNTYYYYKDGAWVQDTIGAENNNLTIKFDKTADKTKLTFKFKFAGTDNVSQVQRIAILMGAQTVHISRDQEGSGSVNLALAGTGCTWSDMKDNEWYTFTGEITPSGFTCSVAGEFDSGYAVKRGTSTTAGTAISRVEIGSPRDLDTISMSLAEVKTPTSVWYIDDVVVEY